MEYAQLTPDGLDAIQVTTHGNVEWDANNFCTAAQLTADGKADQFGVVPLAITEPPTYDPLTQTVVRDGCEVVDGAWQYKWTVHDLTPEEILSRLVSIRNSKWEAIKTERDKRTQQGGYKVGAKWYHSDTFSRSQQLGLVIMGNNIPQALLWKTMDGSFVEMTPALAQGIFQSAALSDSNVFAYAETLNQQVQSSDNPETVDIYSGWPECYLDVV